MKMVNQVGLYLSPLIFFIVVHALFVNQNTVIAADDGKQVSLIEESCNNTRFPDTCLSVLEADSRSKAATNLKNLTWIAMHIVYEETENLNSKFVEVDRNATDPKTKRDAQACIYVFHYCLFHKDDGFAHFESGNYEDAKFDIDSCGEPASECEFTSTGSKLFKKELLTLYNFSTVVREFLSTI